MKLKQLAAAALMGSALLAATPAFAQEKVTVWWEKGFYKAEDDALFAMIKKFEDKTKIKVDLSFYATQVFFPKTSAWDNLQRSMKATFDESVWSHLAGTVSEPFALGDRRRVAVKVIDERGNELMRVLDVAE